jgi:hypothetical protein
MDLKKKIDQSYNIKTMTEKRKTKEESDFFMDFAEEELREVDKLFTTGELNAFGSKEESVLKQIDNISQLQVRAFLSSMEIELK